jgi:hypothetical protein
MIKPTLLKKLTVFIDNLDADDVVQILDICKERLGLLSQQEFKDITGWDKSRQALHDKIKSGKIKTWKLGNINFIILNDK